EDGADALRGDAQRLGGDLRQDGVDPGADLLRARLDDETAARLEPDARRGRLPERAHDGGRDAAAHEIVALLPRAGCERPAAPAEELGAAPVACEQRLRREGESA